MSKFTLLKAYHRDAGYVDLHYLQNSAMSDPDPYSIYAINGMTANSQANIKSSANAVVSSTTQTLTSAAESLFSNQLASALSTISDSQYFGDSISPSSIRTSISASDPSNPNSTPALLKCMKWLLASMSKGRDVSDFFPHVVKLVGSSSLEIRKMVYMYLVHYADHNMTCRELALLSINSFQRGLADSEQWIRALALRVLTSIRVADVLQIQILAVQTCGRDKSPYVRKCAANALAKLYPRCCEEDDIDGDVSTATENEKNSRVLDIDQKSRLIELLSDFLRKESSTMVLSSALCAFHEMCPHKLEMLHSPYRKICHLLTDMEEWSQIIVLDILSRYCRSFFRKPGSENGTIGTAEVIDKQRRVLRTVGVNSKQRCSSEIRESNDIMLEKKLEHSPTPSFPKNRALPRKIKRRVIRKGFYSDEEDESSDEEIYVVGSEQQQQHVSPTLAGAMRQRSIIFGNPSTIPTPSTNDLMMKDKMIANHGISALDEDHHLLLKSSLPLLKSRNAGVVLAVCSLHYYCGEASVEIRSMMGKALVRIYHDRREIQFVVLKSIKMLVWECPSAFTPYLNDFFVKAMDPSFTRLIKLDILTALSLEPNSINAVLKELRTYIRHDDKTFVCATIQAVGNITEMAKIVYEREGNRDGNMETRSESNLIALNCLSGLLILIENSEHDAVIGECVHAIERILLFLGCGNSCVKDPNNIQIMAFRKLFLLLLRALSSLDGTESNSDSIDDDLVINSDAFALNGHIALLSTEKITPALWILGEWMSASSFENKEKKAMLAELLPLLAKSFTRIHTVLKCHAIHFASKIVMIGKCSHSDKELCEYILAMGRIDVNQNVRDRSRFESLVVHMSVGLKFDTEILPKTSVNCERITLESARSMLLRLKPSSSWLPIEDVEASTNFMIDGTNSFRFGTLSSMLSHKTGDMYISLPPWSEENSSSTLRNPPEQEVMTDNDTVGKKEHGWRSDNNQASNDFYSASSSNDSSTLDDGSMSDSTGDDDNETNSSDSTFSNSDESSGSSIDSSSSSSDESDQHLNSHAKRLSQTGLHQVIDIVESINSSDESNPYESDESSSSSSSSTHSSEDERMDYNDSNTEESLIDTKIEQKPIVLKDINSNTSDMEGLVMAPLVLTQDDDIQDKGDIENNSGSWNEMVRYDLSGGLDVNIRFVRGVTRHREAQLLGLDPQDPNIIVLQMKFENRRSDGLAIRRIRVVQRNFTNKNAVQISRVVLPQVIRELGKSQLCYNFLAIQFSEGSDKDNSFISRFDVKSDRGTTQINIIAPICELLEPIKMSLSEFELASQKLQGIHQRLTAKFALSPDTVHSWKEELAKKIRKVAQISFVKDSSDTCIKFVGTLPSSRLEVLVTIIVKSDAKGEIIVCCDDALALNSIIKRLKTAVITH